MNPIVPWFLGNSLVIILGALHRLRPCDLHAFLVWLLSTVPGTHLWSHVGRWLQPFREASESYDHDHDNNGHVQGRHEGQQCQHHWDDNFNSFGGSSGSSCAIGMSHGIGGFRCCSFFSGCSRGMSRSWRLFLHELVEWTWTMWKFPLWLTAGFPLGGDQRLQEVVRVEWLGGTEYFAVWRVEQDAIAFWTHSLGDEYTYGGDDKLHRHNQLHDDDDNKRYVQARDEQQQWQHHHRHQPHDHDDNNRHAQARQNTETCCWNQKLLIKL